MTQGREGGRQNNLELPKTTQHTHPQTTHSLPQQHTHTQKTNTITNKQQHRAPGLPKTRSGKVMRRILRQIALGRYGDLGDTSGLAEPGVVDALVAGAERMQQEEKKKEKA